MQIDFTRVTFRYTFITVLWLLCKNVLSLRWDGLWWKWFSFMVPKSWTIFANKSKEYNCFYFGFLFGCQWVCQVWIFSPQGYCKIYHWQIYKPELLTTCAFYDLKVYFRKCLQNWFISHKNSSLCNSNCKA